MRVSMVTASESDVSVVDLSTALAGTGHRVAVHGVPAGDPAGRLDRFVRVLRQRWDAERPDVVHAHRWAPGLAAVLAARPLGIPVVQTADGFHRAEVEGAVGRVAARVVATSSDELPHLLRLGVRRSRIAVVPHGVDLARFRPEGPQARKRRAHRIVTAASGDGAALDEILSVLPALPDTELVVLSGPRWIEERARVLGVADRVTRAAGVPREGVPALLRSADVVVCGRWCDRPAVLALHAMACGAAVVGAGSMVDTVVDGITGVLVSEGDRRALARAVRGLLADHARRAACGIAGTDRVQARFALDRVACDLADVYAAATRP